MTNIPVFEKGKRIDWQNALYSDANQWGLETVVSPSSRLRIGLRYARLLDLYGLLAGSGLSRKLKILEPGCGVGSLSLILGFFGKTRSFDYSSEAVRIAKELFGDNRSIEFFEGDGTRPSSIGVLKDEKFDFILMREFHPLTRNIAGNPKPVEVVRNYYDMLNKGGVIVIEHSFNINIWRCSEHIFQTSQIIKEFNALIFHTISLDIILRSRFLFKQRLLRALVSGLLDRLTFLYCMVTRRNLSKTIIITR